MASSAPLYRDDTMFGVCAALGEDFGFNANIPRALLGVGLLFAPLATLAAYAAAGLVVAVSRWIAPDPISSEPVEQEAPAISKIVPPEIQDELPLAA